MALPYALPTRGHPAMFASRRLLALAPTLLALSLLHSQARAAAPTEPAERAKVLGRPNAPRVQPPAVTLTGPRSVQQLVVDARYADGNVRDLTAFVEVTLENPAIANLGDELFLTPKQNGATNLVIK